MRANQNAAHVLLVLNLILFNFVLQSEVFRILFCENLRFKMVVRKIWRVTSNTTKFSIAYGLFG